MKTINLFIAMLLLGFSSCENSTTNSDFNARVIGKGMDCGNVYLIQFNDDVQGLPSNQFDNIFYAINLPNNLQVNDLEVKVGFRNPEENEMIPCTTMGIAYPQIIINNQ